MRAKSEERRARGKGRRKESKGLIWHCSVFSVLCLLLYALSSLLFFGGCASLQHKEAVLAVLNGEPITEGDLRYSLMIAHRRGDLSSAGVLNMPEFVQKLVDDRLIIQEARRMGMQDYPEVRQAIDAYVLRESVVRLHDEEIVKKVSVTDDEIKNYYKKNYEQFVLSIVEVDSEEKAREIRQQLREGADFKALAQKYSTHTSQKNGREVVLTRNSLAPSIDKAVSDLKPGEFSDVLEIQTKYYIIELVNRKEALVEGLGKVRGNIVRALRKQKEKERSDEYLKDLRKRFTVQVNDEIMSLINLTEKSEAEKLSQDKRVLVQINGSTLTVGDFVSLVRSYMKSSKALILNDWIERKLIDLEALSRHYERHKDFKEMVGRYEDQILKRTFINKVVVPQIALSDEALKEYYLSHQESFMKPATFKIQQITVKTMQGAEDIVNDLNKGAEFSWMAKNRSVDSAAPEGGNLGWLTKAEMLEPIRKVVKTLRLGSISPIVKIDSFYKIVRLLDRKEGEIEEFAKVKKTVQRAAFEEEVNGILKSYIDQLKKDSNITINNEEVKLLEEKVQE